LGRSNLKVGLNNAITGGVKTQAQAAFNTLRTQITSPHLQKSFEAMLHRFMNANGQPRPQPSQAKSSSAISRMFNQYKLPSLALLRFFLVALIAFVLVFWWVFPLAQGDIPDWIALARAAQVWLLTWVVQFELH
jgi:hypothetical protein